MKPNSNIAALERELAKKRDEASAVFAKTAIDAEKENRERTDDERAQVQKAIDEAHAIQARLDGAKGDDTMAAEIDRLTSTMRPATADEPAKSLVVKSLGQQFVESAAGQFFAEKRHHGHRNWSSPTAELQDGYRLQGTTLTTNPASGGKLVVTDYQGGIQPLMYKRLTVRDLLATGTTDSNSVTYMKETLFTNAAAAVAEGAAKPESALAFDQVVDLVQKIAHWLPVTEEMLEDVPQIRSYIDARLQLGVELTEEDQLLNGSGTPPNIMGILNRVGLTPTVPRGTNTNVDAIFQAMMAVFNASYVMPDAHVINPANWQTIALSKDTTGNYLAGGPFAGTLSPTLWGLPVAVTPSIVAATALTGSFKSSAQIFDRGGMRIEVSNSHQDFFIKNLVAIRAERRLALAVYRPAAFGTATALN
jgi:HK97 family phage major capsid protein